MEMEIKLKLGIESDYEIACEDEQPQKK